MQKNSKVKNFPDICRVLTLLLLSSLLFSCSPQKETAIQLEYFEPRKVAESELLVADPLMNKALNYYRTGNYQKARQVFDTVLTQMPENATAHLYKAISNLALGEVNIARENLQWLLLRQPDRYTHEANWYLGLAYLAKRENQKALPFFVDLKNTSNPYQSKALEVLETFPEGKLFLANTAFDHIYHVGNMGFDFASYFQVAKTELLAIRSSENERQLFLRYNVPMPNEITVRLYDEEGTLQYIEKLSDVEQGAEKKLNLVKLQAGGYNLEVKIDSGKTLNQRIEIHEHGG